MLEYRDQEKRLEHVKNRGTAGCEGIAVFGADRGPGFLPTAQAVFPKATRVVDRCHVFGDRHKALDNERNSWRRKFKDQEDGKRLKGALLKKAKDLTDDQQKKLARAFRLAPPRKLLDEHKEKFRSIVEQRWTRGQGEME